MKEKKPKNLIPCYADCGFELNDIIDETAVNEPALGKVTKAQKGLTNGKAPVFDSHS